MNRNALFVGTALAIAGCGGGDGGPGPGTPVPASVSVSVSSTASMASLGDTRVLTAVVRDASDVVIPGATVTWSATPPNVVSFSSTSGLSVTATAAANGTAAVTARSGSASSSPTTLTVAQVLSSVSVTPATPTVVAGNTRQMTATAQDARGNAIPSITTADWESSNTSVATVNPSSGLVSAVAAGTATITATMTSVGSSKSGNTTVTVTSGGFPSTASVTATASNAFTPATVDIARTGTVTWTFQALHNVTFAGTPGAPSNIPDTPSGTQSRTFNTAGTFPYECTLHSGMTGQVIVH